MSLTGTVMDDWWLISETPQRVYWTDPAGTAYYQDRRTITRARVIGGGITAYTPDTGDTMGTFALYTAPGVLYTYVTGKTFVCIDDQPQIEDAPAGCYVQTQRWYWQGDPTPV